MAYETSYLTESSRIAALLGLKDAMKVDEVTLAHKIAEGLEVQSAIALGSTLGPIINVVGDVVSKSTVRHAQKTRKLLSREMSNRLYNLARVWDATCRSYAGNQKQAKDFLCRGHQFLDGRRPLELAYSSGAGANAVLSLLERADNGFAV